MKRFAIVVAKVEPADGKAPEQLLMWREGWNQVEGEEPFLVDHDAFLLVAGYIQRRGNDVVIDYEHATLTDGEAPAAGWIAGLTWEPGLGIVAKVDWTQKAAGYIERREYRYFSPVSIYRNGDRRLIAVHSVALTNAPRTNHLTPILAKLGTGDIHTEKEATMDWFKKLFAALGLADGATEDDVLASVAKLKANPPDTKQVVAKDVLDALGLADGDTSTVVASIHALKQGVKGMVSKADFDALKKQIAERDAKEIVAKAVADGKITPDQKGWAEKYATDDPDGFAVFVAKAPVVVPVADLPGKNDVAAAAELDGATAVVAKMMGVSKEDIQKYGQA